METYDQYTKVRSRRIYFKTVGLTYYKRVRHDGFQILIIFILLLLYIVSANIQKWMFVYMKSLNSNIVFHAYVFLHRENGVPDELFAYRKVQYIGRTI